MTIAMLCQKPGRGTAARHSNAAGPEASVLYPQATLHDEGTLAVSGGHTLHYEVCGNERGKPVVFLHGGPGGGTSPRHRTFFDPDAYRIILFDQRGCGRSTPTGSLEANTTWDLVRDIESLREHLSIDRWQLFGGSWGSALALAYGQAHPERVTEMVLRGIFLLRESELRWFYQGEVGAIFPEEWSDFVSIIPEGDRHDVLAAYHKLLTCGDREVEVRAAKRWTRWEKQLSYPYHRRNHDELQQVETNDDYCWAFARIECHYFRHRGFLKTDGELLTKIDRIRHVPATIVQGHDDMVCPLVTAWDLHLAWPEAQFHLVPDGGHSAFDVPVARALVEATNAYAHLS